MYGHSNPTVRTTDDGEQVGPKMHSAVLAVARRGCYPCKNQLALSVGPNGSQDYGYRIVNRCLSKNLLALNPGHEDASPGSRGAVVLTDKGAEYVTEHTEQDLDPEEYVDRHAHYSRARDEWRMPGDN
jgi:hypothetical protein